MSDPQVICPFCGSRNTDLFSLFGSSALTSQYYCRDCRTVFERVKWGAPPPGALPPQPPRAGRPRKAGRAPLVPAREARHLKGRSDLERLSILPSGGSAVMKVVTLEEAVARHIRDGMTVALGTGLESCIPFAAGHEIIRQGRRDLTLVGPISDILFDQLIGAGCVSRVIAAWVGNVGAGIAYNFRRAVEEGIPRSLDVEDHSNLTVALALEAGARGVPYLPSRTALGSDLIRDHARLREITCPFTGERLLAVGALRPDVTILHVQRCDRGGNAHLWGNLGVSLEAARASHAVLLTCEEIVESDVIRSDPNRTLVPGFLVGAVAMVPGGSHPSPTQGYVNRDDRFYDEYHAETRTRAGFLAWLDRMVLGAGGHAGYRARLGEDRLDQLLPRSPRLAAPVNYGL